MAISANIRAGLREDWSVGLPANAKRAPEIGSESWLRTHPHGQESDAPRRPLAADIRASVERGDWS